MKKEHGYFKNDIAQFYRETMEKRSLVPDIGYIEK
jgi:hypothetical protein